MSRKPVFVIADDLTGAADAANYFRTVSHRVRVTFNSQVPWMLSLGQDVVQVFDAESRSIDEAMAVQRVFTAGQQLASTLQESFFVYKKIDSTLRGHIGSEMEAALRGLGRSIAVVAPAFPANGRTVRDGELFVNGLPISQTAFARDPRNPVTTDRISDILRTTTSLPVIDLSLGVVNQGPAAIARFLESIAEDMVIVVADAETDRDLVVIAEAIAENPRVLPCGSAGLAKPLASLWVGADGVTFAYEDQLVQRASKSHITTCNRVLLAVGSANPTAHVQLEYAASSLGASIVEMQPVALADVSTHDEEMLRAKQKLLHSPTNVVGVTLSEQRAVRESDIPGSFESDLAEVVLEWVTQIHGVDNAISFGFAATGGDTALAICEALSATAIWPEGEVVSGMPWSVMETPHGNIPLISKAGGFGDADALEQAARFLTTPSPI